MALTAWRIGGPALTAPGALPTPHVAWVGAPPPLPRGEFMDLANGDAELRAGLGALHNLFVQAPLLGSLIEVTGSDLLNPVCIGRIETGMAALVERMRGAEPERAEGALAARGMADATAILTRRYVLQATNVPFLGRGRQAQALAKHLSDRLEDAKSDLATAIIQRMRWLTTAGGTVAGVTPQNWLFLGSYRGFRHSLLTQSALTIITVIGEHGFDSQAAAGAFTMMVVATEALPSSRECFLGLDISNASDPSSKANALEIEPVNIVAQNTQLGHPDARISVYEQKSGRLLNEVCFSPNGMHGADSPRFRQMFWEHVLLDRRWTLFQLTVDQTTAFGGREHVFWWPDHGRWHDSNAQARIQGMEAWGQVGVQISMMRELAVTRYTGEPFDISGSPIVPYDSSHLPAIWSFCSSPDYSIAVRRIDQALKVTNATLVKVPFDLAHWQAVAAEKYPNGLPEPYSDDPTQWLFHGHPAHSEIGTALHVALARLAGYCWPAETDAAMRLAPEAREKIAQAAALPAPDADGLLPLHAHGADPALADRLRIHLAAAFGAPLSPEAEAALVRAADGKLDGKEARDATLEAWLRDRAFRQHSKLFHNRPFLWHVWDGLPRDGFSAFLHYHRLDHALLEKLTYTVLGDWITRAAAAGQTAKHEAALRLQQTLGKILHGEAPHDIFVRWKPLARQPVGWTPDLDDGVRLNIRPFMEAGILREPPRGIAWGKDRGADFPSAPWFRLGPAYGEKEGARINGHHLTLADKHAARNAAPLAAD